MPTDRTHAGAGISAPNPTPPVLAGWLSPFRAYFSAPVWSRVLVLVAGAVLAPGKRTVSQALRVMGLAAGPGFACQSALKRDPGSASNRDPGGSGLCR